MMRLPLLLLCTLFVFLSSCSSSPIDYNLDYQPSVNFSAYKTYSWHPPNEFNKSSNSYIANDLVDERIRENVDKQLAKNGYQKVTGNSADFFVNYSILTQDKIDIRTYNTYNGYVSGWRAAGHYGAPYRYYGVGYRSLEPEVEAKVTEYTQGTFVLDIISGESTKLVWRGTAAGRMSKSKLSPAEREAVIAEVVEKVLSGFPPK